MPCSAAYAMTASSSADATPRRRARGAITKQTTEVTSASSTGCSTGDAVSRANSSRGPMLTQPTGPASSYAIIPAVRFAREARRTARWCSSRCSAGLECS